MAEATAKFLLRMGDEQLLNSVRKELQSLNFSVSYKIESDVDYQVIFVDLLRDEANLSVTILDYFSALKGFRGKTCLVLLCQSNQRSAAIEKVLGLVRPQLSQNGLNLRLVVCYDLYQEGPPPLSEFHHYVGQSIAKRKISVNATEGNHYYPTSVRDLCRLITKSLFVTNTSGEIFTIGGEDLTDTEVGYLLKRGLEKKGQTFDLNLDAPLTRPGQMVGELSIQTQAFLNWLPQDSFADAVGAMIASAQSSPENIDEGEKPIKERAAAQKILQSLKGSLETKTVAKQKKREPESMELHRYEKKKIGWLISVVSFVGIILIVIPIASTAVTLYLTARDTYVSYQELRRGSLAVARQKLSSATVYRKIADGGYQLLQPLVQTFVRKDAVTVNNLLLALDHTQTVLGDLLDTYDQANHLYLSLIGKQAADQRSLLAALKVNLVSLSEKLSQVQLFVSDFTLPFGFSQSLDREITIAQITLLKSQIGSSLPLIELLDKMLANTKEQRLLVLIQDNNELRPGGGFISSFAIATIRQGRIISIQTESALSLDKNIDGQIEPPKILKQLTGQTQWLFHDSNLDPDNSVNARQAAWFYERLGGGNVDGVIGLNLNVYEVLLKEIGAITLADGREVGSENLNLLASNPTASKGQDVVTGLTKSLSERLLADEIPFAILARALITSATHNEITMWFPDENLQSLAEDARVTGTTRPDTCHPQLSAENCFADTVYLNESNFSISKINYYLKRQVTIESQISENGEVRYALIYDYTYPVPAPTNFGSVYNSYYQFYYPETGKDLKITLDGQPLTNAALLRSSQPNGLTKIDFSANQNTNQPHRLIITFTSGRTLNLRAVNIPFTLSVLKQPGTMGDKGVIRVKHPAFLLPRVMTLPLKQTAANELTLQVSPVSRENIGILFKNQSL